jgi:hypothetical protein
MNDASLEYRPLSAAAVAGCVLAVLSLAVLVEWNLWPLPLVAGALCLRGWWLTRGEEPARTGRLWAVSGLLLSAALTVSAPAQWLWFRHRLQQEALAVGRQWLQDLSRGETDAAFRLTLDPAHRPAKPQLVPDWVRGRVAGAEDLRDFLAQPLVAWMLQAGGRVEIRQAQLQEQSGGFRRDWLTIRYCLSALESGQEHDRWVVLRLDRVSRRADDKNARHLGLTAWQVFLLDQGQ